MIPKKIHYCWFGGGDKPKSAEKCIASWRKYCPNYEIIEWNEDNFDINSCEYIIQAYEAKKYAFVSDYARFWILYHHGGLYFDTDVELLKPIDEIVKKGAFMGCERDGCDLSQRIHVSSENAHVNPGLGIAAAPGLGIAAAPGLGIAAAPGLGIYKEILDLYHTLHFKNADGSFNTKTVVAYTTEVLKKHGLKDIKGIQKIEDIWLYPQEYFNPYDDNTGKLNITDNTHSIHWYSKSWIDPKSKLISKITKPFHRIFGNNCFEWIKKFVRK